MLRGVELTRDDCRHCLQELYGKHRPAASPGIGAFPSHDVNAQTWSQDAPSQQPSGQLRSVSFQRHDAGVAHALGASSDPPLAQALAAIQAGLRQRGVHGALALEAAFRTCRQQQSGMIGALSHRKFTRSGWMERNVLAGVK